MTDTVFLLWHVREMPDQEEDAKLLGVYSSELKAEQARDDAKAQPGFCDYPDGFHISRYRVDERKWIEGFVTVMTTSQESES